MSRPGASRLELPPPLEERDPIWSIGFDMGWFVPVERESLCPTGADCILDGGFSFGAVVEKRWASGIGLGLGYDATLLDSNAVYEIGVLQTLRLIGRYIFFDTTNVHPFVSVSGGPALFGDTFLADTYGAVFDVAAGVEIELNETVWLMVSVPWRIVVTDDFVTRTDKVRRAEAGGNTAFILRVGISILEAP